MSVRGIANYYGEPTVTLYAVFRRLGIPTRSRCESKTGELNPNWTGGRYKTKFGYVMVMCAGHPRATRDKYVFEHILEWERHHNKRLPKNYVIHH